MGDITVDFCAECGDEIKSYKLSNFYRKVCFLSLCKNKWLSFHQDEELEVQCIEILEKKRFVISSDHGKKIVVRPRGMMKEEEDHYLICLRPEIHQI